MTLVWLAGSEKRESPNTWEFMAKYCQGEIGKDSPRDSQNDMENNCKMLRHN
jgi:hypothetical protein